MQSYLNAQPIDFVIPLLDANGNAVVASDVSWTLINERNEVAASGSMTPESTATDVIIALSAEEVTISNGDIQEVRELSVLITYDGGSISHDEIFMLTDKQVLVVGVNSAVTYLQALRLYPTFPTFAAFGWVSDEQRKNALIAAWRNIGSVELSEGAIVDEFGNPLYDENDSLIYSVNQLSPALFLKLNSKIATDLRAAQLEEAEFLLGGDGIEDLRTRGVMSYTVGEVKQFFRTSKPIELVVSKHALRYLGKYVQYHRRLTRV